MKFGVSENQLIVHLPSGYSAFSGKLDSKEKREDVATQLIGAAALIMRDDFSTRQELVEFLLDSLE